MFSWQRDTGEHKSGITIDKSQRIIDGRKFAQGWLKTAKNKRKIKIESLLNDIDKKLSNQNLVTRAPKDIIENEMYFIDAIGLKEHLSMTRSNGLVSMIKQMKF